MKRNIFAAVLIVVLAAWFVMNRTAAQQDEASPDSPKIQQLLQQRQDVLQQRYNAVKHRHEDGTRQYDRVASALDDLLKAKLELAASRQERLDICKQRVDNMRSLEEIAEGQVKNGDGTIDEKLLATAARLQAEIDCLRDGS